MKRRVLAWPFAAAGFELNRRSAAGAKDDPGDHAGNRETPAHCGNDYPRREEVPEHQFGASRWPIS